MEVGDGGAYEINFKRGKFNKSPIRGCNGSGMDKFGVYRHFCFRHPNAKVIINEDSELDRCGLCGMFTKDVLKHQRSSTYEKGRYRRNNINKQNLQSNVSNIKFFINGHELERVSSFKYLSRIFSEDNNNSLYIQEQIKKARNR